MEKAWSLALWSMLVCRIAIITDNSKGDGTGTIPRQKGRSEKFLAFKVCFYDTLVPAREYKSGYAADRFARKCAAQGLWCSLHGLAVADGSCEWVEISAC